MAIVDRNGDPNPLPHSGEGGESTAEKPQRWSVDEATRIGAPPEGKQRAGFLSEALSADWMNWAFGWKSWAARTVIPFVEDSTSPSNGLRAGTPVLVSNGGVDQPQADAYDVEPPNSLANLGTMELTAQARADVDGETQRGVALRAAALQTQTLLCSNDEKPIDVRGVGDLNIDDEREYPLADMRMRELHLHASDFVDEVLSASVRVTTEILSPIVRRLFVEVDNFRVKGRAILDGLLEVDGLAALDDVSITGTLQGGNVVMPVVVGAVSGTTFTGLDPTGLIDSVDVASGGTQEINFTRSSTWSVQLTPSATTSDVPLKVLKSSDSILVYKEATVLSYQIAIYDIG